MKNLFKISFYAHVESIKLFNTFSIVFVIDSTYNINKYKLHLLEFVGVTSIEMAYSIAFAFMECEKEDNVTRTLEMCRNLLKDTNNMPYVIVNDRDTSLMNYF